MATVQLGSKAVGSTVKLNVNGSPREFLVVQQGLPSSMYDESCNGTWLLMKDCYESRQWNSSNVNDYANSTIHSYLNSTFLNLFDANIKAAIKQVKLPYRAGSGYGKTVTSGASGLSARIFLLSSTEVNLVNGYEPTNEGACLSYFTGTAQNGADNKRIAKLNGSAVAWWLRSPCCNSNYDATRALYVYTDGSWSSSNCSYSYGIRPALILPSSLFVSDDGTVITNEPPTAPATITVPQVTAGDPAAITWTAATDPDGTVTSYHLERSVNESGWEEIYTGAALTYTDTIGASWGTVAYRVCAEDDKGATGPYTTSEIQEVQAGILYISGPAPDMGLITSQFSFQVSTGISGHTEVVGGISLDIQLDGAQLYSGTVETGQAVAVPLDPRVLASGTHTVKAKAAKQDYVAAEQSYSFSTPAVTFPAGGLGVQLQDEQGTPIFPQSAAALVQGFGGDSLGANLQELFAAVTPTPDPSAAQLRKVVLSTEDLQAGVSPLPTGQLYFVYE